MDFYMRSTRVPTSYGEMEQHPLINIWNIVLNKFTFNQSPSHNQKVELLNEKHLDFVSL